MFSPRAAPGDFVAQAALREARYGSRDEVRALKNAWWQERLASIEFAVDAMHGVCLVKQRNSAESWLNRASLAVLCCLTLPSLRRVWMITSSVARPVNLQALQALPSADPQPGSGHGRRAIQKLANNRAPTPL